MEDNFKHGRGKVITQAGSIYEGEFLDGAGMVKVK